MSATQHDKAFFLALGRAVCSISFGTVPPIFTPKMLKKQDGMVAFFHASGRCRTNVLQSILVSFSLPGAPFLSAFGIPGPSRAPPGGSLGPGAEKSSKIEGFRAAMGDRLGLPFQLFR